MSATGGVKTARSGEGGDDSLVIAFDDNRLLTELFGTNDRNLARIEQGLGVLATSRGNKLVITGKPHARNQADRVFRDLYARLKSGQDVTAGRSMARSALQPRPKPISTSRKAASVATRSRRSAASSRRARRRKAPISTR